MEVTSAIGWKAKRISHKTSIRLHGFLRELVIIIYCIVLRHYNTRQASAEDNNGRG